MTHPTQEDDVKAIRDALALGPTLGKWSVDGHFGEWGISSDHSVGGACKSGRQFVAACFRVSKKDTPKYAAMFEATARYIAEANPERIARLLARLEQAERDGPIMERGKRSDGTPYIGTMREVLNDYKSAAQVEAKDGDRARAELAQLRAAIKEAGK